MTHHQSNDARPPTSPSCLLVGYNGTNNVGSDARLVAILADVRKCFGAQCRVTIATLDAAKTRRILDVDAYTTLVQVSVLFVPTLTRLVAKHDVIFLVEGSTFKQNWSQALLYGYLWVAFCARLFGKQCIAYAVDVGELTPINRFLTARACSGLSLLTTRTEAAKRRLLDMGVTRNIEVNADPAFLFSRESSTVPPVGAARRKSVGIAAVEFFHWPVRLRLIGPTRRLYRWPFYFSWDRRREALSARMVSAYVGFLMRCIEVHDFDVVLIAMEEIDLPVCEQILARLSPAERERTRVVSSAQSTTREVTAALAQFDFLVTGRYHAAVLSMRSAVPQMAVYHDERLESLYEDLGLSPFLIHCESASIELEIESTFNRLLAESERVASVLRRQHDEVLVPSAENNARLLSTWALANGRLMVGRNASGITAKKESRAI